MLKFQNIFIVGPLGVGKTTIGSVLAKELKMEFCDSDQVIEERAGVDIAWIFDVEGEEGFRLREMAVIDELTQKRGIVLATGGGAVLAAENRKNLAARGTVIFLDTSLDQQMLRVERDSKRPLIQTDNRQETLKGLKKERDPFYQEIADFTFLTEGKNARTVANEIIGKLYKKT